MPGRHAVVHKYILIRLRALFCVYEKCVLLYANFSKSASNDICCCMCGGKKEILTGNLFDNEFDHVCKHFALPDHRSTKHWPHFWSQIK